MAYTGRRKIKLLTEDSQVLRITDIANIVSAKLGVTKKDAKAIITCAVNTIVEEAKNYNIIVLKGFGTFGLERTKHTSYYDLDTKQMIELLESRLKLKFRLTDKLHEYHAPVIDETKEMKEIEVNTDRDPRVFKEEKE